MNAIRRNFGGSRPETGQSIYQTMLVIACVALALAVFLPTFEYFRYYFGTAGEAVAVERPRGERPEGPRPPAAGPSEAPEPAADAGAMLAPTTTVAPSAAGEAAQAAEGTGETAPGTE